MRLCQPAQTYRHMPKVEWKHARLTHRSRKSAWIRTNFLCCFFKNLLDTYTHLVISCLQLMLSYVLCTSLGTKGAIVGQLIQGFYSEQPQLQVPHYSLLLLAAPSKTFPFLCVGNRQPQGLPLALVYRVLCKSTAVSGLSAALSDALYPKVSTGCALRGFLHHPCNP